MPYHLEIEAQLGKRAYKAFLCAVENGGVSVQQAETIAFTLHPTVGGRFKNKRTSGFYFSWGRFEARELLSHYYETCCDAEQGTERRRVIDILREEVELKSLAKEMEEGILLDGLQLAQVEVNTTDQSATATPSNTRSGAATVQQEVRHHWAPRSGFHRLV